MAQEVQFLCVQRAALGEVVHLQVVPGTSERQVITDNAGLFDADRPIEVYELDKPAVLALTVTPQPAKVTVKPV